LETKNLDGTVTEFSWVSSALNIFMHAISNCLCRSQTCEPCQIYKRFLVIVL
jgi:hypothetical protein